MPDDLKTAKPGFDKGNPDGRIHDTLWFQARPVPGGQPGWTICMWRRGAGYYLPVLFKHEKSALTLGNTLTKVLKPHADRYERDYKRRQAVVAQSKVEAARKKYAAKV